MEKINSSDLISHIAVAIGISKAKVKEVFDATALWIVGAVGNGQEVQLSDLGKFYPSKRVAKTCKTPFTGGTVDIPARVTLGFRASKKNRDI